MDPRKICLMVLLWGGFLVSGPSAVAHSKEKRQYLAQLDERKIADGTMALMVTPVNEKKFFHPEEFTANLDDFLDYMIEGTNIHQYARSFVVRFALDNLPSIDRAKSEAEFESVLRFIGFTMAWSNDNLLGHFKIFINNMTIDLGLRLKALLFVLKAADEELIKMPPSRRESRRVQLDAIQKAVLTGWELADYGARHGGVSDEIRDVANAITERFCGNILDPRRE